VRVKANWLAPVFVPFYGERLLPNPRRPEESTFDLRNPFLLERKSACQKNRNLAKLPQIARAAPDPVHAGSDPIAQGAIRRENVWQAVIRIRGNVVQQIVQRLVDQRAGLAS
jgi:hypothetical protein